MLTVSRAILDSRTSNRHSTDRTMLGCEKSRGYMIPMMPSMHLRLLGRTSGRCPMDGCVGSNFIF